VEALIEFVTHLNSVHHSLKFTCEHSQESIPVLDTRITLDSSRTLYTTLYNKPTDTHSYLHYSSCHPHHQKTGGPYSQLLRVRLICSKDTDFEFNALKIVAFYKNRGYPTRILHEHLEKVRTLQRSNLLAIKDT
jgi:hypothetical protein